MAKMGKSIQKLLKSLSMTKIVNTRKMAENGKSA